MKPEYHFQETETQTVPHNFHQEQPGQPTNRFGDLVIPQNSIKRIENNRKNQPSNATRSTNNSIKAAYQLNAYRTHRGAPIKK
jgi:hypothetical protein